MDVLDGLMNQRTEQHGVLPDGHELKLLVELILQPAGLVNRDMRREGVGVLDIYVLHGLELKLVEVEAAALHGRKRFIDVPEVEAGCPAALVAGQDQEVLSAGEGRVVKPPEIKELGLIRRLKRGPLEVTLLNLCHKRVVLGAWEAAHGIDKHDGELHPFGLMDSHEGDAAAGRVLRIVLVFRYAAVVEQTEIEVKELLRVHIYKLGVQGVNPVEILELADNLGQLCEVPRRANVHDPGVKVCVKDTRKGLEPKELIEQPGIGVVRRLFQFKVCPSPVKYHLTQSGVFALCQEAVCQLDAIRVIPDMVILKKLKLPFFKALNVAREHQHEASQSEANLFALKEHIGARGIDADTFGLKEPRKPDRVVAGNRPEQKGYLIVVRQLAGLMKTLDKAKNLFMPLLDVVYAGQLHSSRA